MLQCEKITALFFSLNSNRLNARSSSICLHEIASRLFLTPIHVISNAISFISYTNLVNDHGSSNQRYAFSSDTYGSLFGTSLDLKSDLMAQQPTQIGFTVSTSGLHQQQQQLGLQNILSAAALQQGNHSLGGGSHHGLAGMKPCSMNSTVTPTIYTIEDHGGGNPLINLAPSGITAGNTSENEPTSTTAAQHKKRKLSMTECFPITVGAMSNTNKSTSVKQEPRN